MKKKNQPAVVADIRTKLEQTKARAEQAEARVEQAKTRAEQAETRTEQAKVRTEQAETRVEQVKTRAEQAETRAEQAETILQHVIHKKVDLRQGDALLKNISVDVLADANKSLEQLTGRQRDILRLIAEGQTTKQIGHILKVSPKTVEYHRLKLMNSLNIHDVPGLVRFALQAGLLPQE